MNKKRLLLIVCLFAIVLFTATVYAQSSNPAIQRTLDLINKANTENTMDFEVKISFFIAFIAGTLGILSPCILPFLPAYFSYTFKEKKNITYMTFIFFLGFSLVFVTMGIIAGFIGSQTFGKVQQGWLVAIAGLFMIFLGIITIKGKQICSFININKKFNNDSYGTFLFGMFFAIGWSACLGPILAGILGIGALLNNILFSAMLMVFYSFGNLVPLFIISMFYDKLNIANSKFIQGKILEPKIFGKTYYIHSTNLISGIMFLLIGFVLVIFRGTNIVNAWDVLGTKDYFYSIQRVLIEWQYANIVGIFGFALFAGILGYFIIKNKRK